MGTPAGPHPAVPEEADSRGLCSRRTALRMCRGRMRMCHGRMRTALRMRAGRISIIDLKEIVNTDMSYVQVSISTRILG